MSSSPVDYIYSLPTLVAGVGFEEPEHCRHYISVLVPNLP